MKMATRIAMKHKDSGMLSDGFYGFSWTSLFFGFFPALFRGDIVTSVVIFFVHIMVGMVIPIFGSVIVLVAWAFMYNNLYTKKLMEKGYAFAGSDSENTSAESHFGIDKKMT